MKFIYRLSHGYFNGGGYFRYAPTITSSAWACNNYLICVNPKVKRYGEPYSTPYYDELKKHGIRMPCFLAHIRTDAARIEKPRDARMFRMLFLTPRTDGCCGTIDTSSLTNQIMENNDSNMSNLEYHQHPTKEQLLEYFSQRIAIRKMTGKEAFRSMDVDDSDIDKIMNTTETVTLKNGMVKTKKAISKTACYKLAGNSIVVSCLYHLFRTMFLPGQPENQTAKPIQPSLFD